MLNQIKKITAMLLAVFMAATMVPSALADSVVSGGYGGISVQSDEDDSTSADYTIKVGETVTITGSGFSRNNTWSSSDNSTASVTGNGSKASVQGLNAGTVTVTHTYGSWIKSTEEFIVEILPVYTGSLSLEAEPNQIGVGETAVLKADKAILNSDGTKNSKETDKAEVRYSISNGTEYISLDDANATVTGKGEGAAAVKAELVYGGTVMSTAECEIEVVSAAIKLDKNTLALAAGKSGVLTAQVVPAGTEVSWESSDTNIVTVDEAGNLIAAGNLTETQTAAVTASITVNGTVLTDSCAVTVKAYQTSDKTYPVELGYYDENSSWQKVDEYRLSTGVIANNAPETLEEEGYSAYRGYEYVKAEAGDSNIVSISYNTDKAAYYYTTEEGQVGASELPTGTKIRLVYAYTAPNVAIEYQVWVDGVRSEDEELIEAAYTGVETWKKGTPCTFAVNEIKGYTLENISINGQNGTEYQNGSAYTFIPGNNTTVRIDYKAIQNYTLKLSGSNVIYSIGGGTYKSSSAYTTTFPASTTEISFSITAYNQWDNNVKRFAANQFTVTIDGSQHIINIPQTLAHQRKRHYRMVRT